ncbi:UNVERIFIED_CONTAM: hypothetical protein FKN15_017608 [Acipenser sinensis]
MDSVGRRMIEKQDTKTGRGRQPIDIRLSVMAVTRRGLPIESITGAEALVESCGDGEPQKKKRATEQSISSSRGETLGSPSLLLLGAVALACLALDLLFLLFYSFWLCCRRRKSEEPVNADCCCTAWCVIIATLVCRVCFLGVLTLIISWASLGLELAVSAGSSDFCVSPDIYISKVAEEHEVVSKVDLQQWS